MLDFIKRNRIWLAGLGLLILLVVLVSIRSADSTRARMVDETLNAVAHPIQSVFTATAGWFAGLFDRYIFLVRTEEENDRLRLENRSLKEELNHHINGSIQFNLLREQLKFKEEDPERRVYAEVIGESLDNFHNTLLINKGYLARIRRNYPVVLREGVVGRVQSVTALHSLVQLVIDRRHRFPVIIQRSRERLILEGGGGNLRLMAPDRGVAMGQGGGLRMERLRMLADVRLGDRVISSGLGGIFPKGLLVGLITHVSREKHELFQTAEISPMVDFNKIEGVYVIIKDGKDAQQPLFTKP